MRLLKYELKKLLTSKLTVISFVVLLGFSLFTQLQINAAKPQTVDLYSYGWGYGPGTDAEKLTAQYAGEVTQEWYDNIVAEYEEYITDPANRISEQEVDALIEEWRAEGWDEDNIEYLLNDPARLLKYDNAPILKVRADAEQLISYFERAEMYATDVSEIYRERYPGDMGEAMAAKLTEMMDTFIAEYTLYYDYDYGWWDIRTMHLLFPATLGLLIVIALSPLFCYDRSRRTESIVFSTRHGRKKLIFAKLGAGFTFAFMLWLIFELVTVSAAFIKYGASGAAASWPDFYYYDAPFVFNQLQITLVTMITSLFGVLMTAALVMMVSALAKGRYATLIISAALTVVPALDSLYIYIFGKDSFMETVFDFFPGRILGAINEWQFLDLLYIFGVAVPTEYLLIPAAIIFGAGMSVICFFRYRNRQPAN
ncbi:MAG: hypothetical protein J1E39_09680 [Eubacterium sp.]|nr:hypothetical protein [Eubacterium sp.]